MKRFNLLDYFLGLILVLAALSIYFSFVRPIQFSNLIQREGVSRYVEVEMFLPPDLEWIKSTVPVGEEFKNVYGQLDWKILAFEDVTLETRKWTKLRAKILIVEESSGILRYGKYTLVKGNKLYLINDHYFIEGRVVDFKLLDERVGL